MDNATPPPTPLDGRPAASADADKAKRERSKIEFPYSDLQSAVEMVSTLQSRAGTSCELTQLAGWMNQTATGGTFRSRLGAAKMFGLIETDHEGVSVTNLGRDAVDDVKGPSARAAAFLNAPLFQAMYDQYQGYALPPAAAIERQMEQLGVPSKQKERARQVFVKSAQYAGYVADNGRIIKPANAAPPPSTETTRKRNDGSGGGDGGDSDIHPFIRRLLQKLPPPHSNWPIADQAKWLQTAASVLGRIYESDTVAFIEVTAHEI